jgi:hypothetical protein
MRILGAKRWSAFIALPLLGLAGGACSSSSPPSGPAGGPVMGALDDHCGDGDGGVAATVVGACMAVGSTDAGAPTVDYGPTLYNAEGDDDDCKYRVAWTSTPVREGQNVTFTLTLSKLADMTPATGAKTRSEVFLNDSHAVAPPPQASESPPGTYEVGPIKFDAPGDWTVRFHFYEDCDDAPSDTPHGHAAFFVRVPNPNPDAATD